jgi:hypothetical protein
MYESDKFRKKSSLLLKLNCCGVSCNRALINLKIILKTKNIENKNTKKNKLSN